MRAKRLAGVLLLLAVLTTTWGALAAPVPSQGVYTDSAGTRHTWTVNASQALIWDGQPFLPVGGLFQAKSWGRDATEEDWKEDAAALAALKSQAITDILVQPARGGITGAKPEQVQRLLDLLDAEGFTYGISLNDGPRNPLTGYLIRPGAFRQANLTAGSTVQFQVPNLESSLYFTVAASTGEVVDAGKSTPVNDGIRVAVPSQPGEMVVFLVPEQIHFPGSGLGYPNLWEGFDSYRDSVLALFSKVKPGKGLRFFVDALPSDLSLSDAGKRFIPANESFRAEWTAWLSRRYRILEQVHTAWAIPERDLREMSEAARLIPLWSGGKGLDAFYDVVTGKRIKADSSRSLFWKDLEAFQADSLRGYMNAMADVLKREVAGVPVIYRWTGYAPLFASVPARSGFDGIGLDAYGSGQELVTRSAGYAYAQARESSRALWMPVTGTRGNVAPNAKETGYPSRTVLFNDLDWLRGIGAKGFYVDALRKADAERAGYDLHARPDQLAWLRDYRTMLETTSGMDVFQPPVIPYPRSYAVASLRPLPGGGWWLPSDQATPLYDFGDLGQAYALSTEQGTVYYLWNPYGTREVRLRIPKPSKDPQAPRIMTSDPAAEVKKEILTVHVGPEPVSIRNLPYAPVPIDAFDEMMKEAERLLPVTRTSAPSGMATLFGQRISWLRARYRPENPMPYIGDVRTLLEMMRASVRPYLWVEAENAPGHSFDENREQEGASGGHVLTVGERAAGRTPAVGTYAVVVPSTGKYDVWFSANPEAAFTFRIDGQPVAFDAATPSGSSYAGGLVWQRAGSVPLNAGNHTLEIQAHGPVTIDALLLTKGAFQPNGPMPPPIEAPEVKAEKD